MLLHENSPTKWIEGDNTDSLIVYLLYISTHKYLLAIFTENLTR